MARHFAPLLTLILLAIPGIAQACVGCRQPGPDTEENTLLAGIALSWSVLFMLCVIFLVVGTMAVIMTRACQKVSRQHAEILRRNP